MFESALELCLKMVYTKKRKAADSDSDQLTGGSGDVNPQFFTMGFITQSTNDTPVVAAYALPIPRLKTFADKQLVMEMLQTKFIADTPTVVAGGAPTFYMALTTNPAVGASTNIAQMQADPRTLADWSFCIEGGAAVTPAVTYIPLDRYVNMTDSSGHGILLATDQLFLFVTTSGTSAHSFSGAAKLLFRFKEVDLADYIGIVQGQQ